MGPPSLVLGVKLVALNARDDDHALSGRGRALRDLLLVHKEGSRSHGRMAQTPASSG